MNTALVFSTASNPISSCPPNWEVLTALLKLIVALKNKFIQLLAQHHLSNSKWLGINSLCHLSYFEEEENVEEATFYFGCILYEMCGVIGTRYINFVLG